MRVIPDLLTADELAQLTGLVARGPWIPGATTAGARARAVKDNAQLEPGSAAAREAGAIVLAALGRSALFVSAALPDRISPPLFSRYEPGQGYGAHVDNAMQADAAGRLRADVSATLFLAAPDTYDGGELVVEEGSAAQRVKLPAGALILYPSTSLHRVEPVTRDARLAAVFWVQSLVRDAGARQILFELDGAIQAIGDHDAALRLSAVYHNLLRRWQG